jgi:hypothetical protein
LVFFVWPGQLKAEPLKGPGWPLSFWCTTAEAMVFIGCHHPDVSYYFE